MIIIKVNNYNILEFPLLCQLYRFFTCIVNTTLVVFQVVFWLYIGGGGQILMEEVSVPLYLRSWY